MEIRLAASAAGRQRAMRHVIRLVTLLPLVLLPACAAAVSPDGTAESGILYGSNVRLKVGSGGLHGTSPSTSADEAGLSFSGNFGRVDLGRGAGAAH